MQAPAITLLAVVLLAAACVADDPVADPTALALTEPSPSASPTASPSPSPTASPSPSPSPTASPSPSPTASPSPSPTATPTPTPTPCVAQPEPDCPNPPSGYAARDPGLANGSLCRGACGADCPTTCRSGGSTSTCLEWQTADCQWHAKVCTYAITECGSHAGCRTHDACYDRCAVGLRGALCRRQCDADCIATHGAGNCGSWMNGNGPYDSWLSFTSAPTSYTYDSTCY